MKTVDSPHVVCVRKRLCVSQEDKGPTSDTCTGGRGMSLWFVWGKSRRERMCSMRANSARDCQHVCVFVYEIYTCVPMCACT